MQEKILELIVLNIKWIWKQGKFFRYKFMPFNFDIAISIKSAEGLNSGQYYKQLNSDLKKLLNENNFTKKLIIKNFTDIIYFEDNQDALKFVKKNKLNLLIWGEFSADNLKQNGENINELNLNFTFLHPQDVQGLLGQTIWADVAANNNLNGGWKIHENNSFIEVKIISRNLFDISIYTIALTLKLFRDFLLSAELLEGLLKNITDDKQLKDAVTFHLINCYEILSFNCLKDKRDYKLGEKYLLKILALDSSSYVVKSNLALCKFQNGDSISGEKLIEEVYKQSPHSPIGKLSFAFLSIRKKNYKKAYRMYQKFFEIKEPSFEPLEAIDFLNSEYEKNKDPAYMYGSAILNYLYKDQTLGIRDLRKFIKKADKNTMSDMVKRATQLIVSSN